MSVQIQRTEAPAQAGAHWAENAATRRWFFATIKGEANKLGVNASYETLKFAALKVEHLKDFPGSADDAITAVRLWLTNEAKRLGATQLF